MNNQAKTDILYTEIIIQIQNIFSIIKSKINLYNYTF